MNATWATIAIPVILEAALRALVAAAAVWGSLRLLRVANVFVLKTAWALVLVAALALPLVPQWKLLPAWATLRLPTFTSEPAHNTTKSTDAPVMRYSAPSTFDNGTKTAARPVMPAAKSRPSQKPDATLADDALLNAYIPQAETVRKNSTDAASSTANYGQNVATVSPAGTRTSSHIALWLAASAAVVYLAVFAALFLRLMIGLFAALRIWQRAEPVLIPGLMTDRLRFSRHVASPVNIGSCIILPTSYRAWDERKLRVVLAHEQSHIRQGDFYLQLLAGLYAAMFWFSPLGWWLKRKLYELGEAISDRAGLNEAASRSAYAQLLLEFAALPRPTLTGVAMARTSHLAQRIERLLNESSFRQSFAAGGRRALFAVLLVPAALIAATALVRVEAATQDQQTAQAATTGQSTPEQVTDQTPPPPGPPDAAPNADVPPPPPGPAPEDGAMQGPPPPPQNFGAGPSAPPQPPNPDDGPALAAGPMGAMQSHPRPRPGRDHDRGFGFGPMGEPYAVVNADGKIVTPNGMIRMDKEGPGMEGLEQARKSAHGPFLWFQHDGKSYIVQDTAVVNQVEAMNKPMENLREQMNELGKQMRATGDQQRELGKKMRETQVQTPDLTKEIADLNAAAAALKAKQGGTINQKDLMELQRQLGHVQGELGALQGKIGAQSFEMGKFGGQMGELGGQMGKLGAEMGKQARENHEKMEGIIKDSLSNGKAKPVQ
jgi:beta-lactamase regulating signal transducer with metallopeptidase domain